jgi:hypothetical protein
MNAFPARGKTTTSKGTSNVCVIQSFASRGLFVGSGVIEAGCKTVLGRLKWSAMFWTVRGVDAIIALRCPQISGKFENYWRARRA